MLADFRDHASPLRIMQEDHYEKTLSEPKMREVRNAEHDRLQDFPVFQITHGYATTISTSVHSYAAGPSSSCAALLHTAETGRLPRIIVMIWAYNGIYSRIWGVSVAKPQGYRGHAGPRKSLSGLQRTSFSPLTWL
jgi:hypothetical protein